MKREKSTFDKLKEVMDEKDKKDTFNDKLDALKYMSEVQSSIKKNVTSDFILAILDEKSKEGIIELTADAYYSQRILDQIQRRAKRWKWNEQTKKWELEGLTDDDVRKIGNIKENAFNAYMTRIQMAAVVNRNVPNNHILKLLAEAKEDQQAATVDDRTAMQKIKDVIGPEKDKK